MNLLSSSVDLMTFRLLAAPLPHTSTVFLGGEVAESMFPSGLYSIVSYSLYFGQFVLITIYCKQKLLREGLKDPLLLDVCGKETQKQAGPLFLRQVTGISIGEIGIERPSFSFSFYLWRSCSLTLISSAYIIVVMNILKGNGEIKRLRKSFQYYFMLCKPYLKS